MRWSAQEHAMLWAAQGRNTKKKLQGVGSVLSCTGWKDHGEGRKTVVCVGDVRVPSSHPLISKLTWLVLGGDPAARSHRVEQFTAL